MAAGSAALLLRLRRKATTNVARATALAPRYVGCRARFIDEDQVFRVQANLARTPFLAGLGDIGAILFGGPLRLFMGAKPS